MWYYSLTVPPPQENLSRKPTWMQTAMSSHTGEDVVWVALSSKHDFYRVCNVWVVQWRGGRLCPVSCFHKALPGGWPGYLSLWRTSRAHPEVLCAAVHSEWGFYWLCNNCSTVAMISRSVQVGGVSAGVSFAPSWAANGVENTDFCMHSTCIAEPYWVFGNCSDSAPCTSVWVEVLSVGLVVFL